MDESKRKFAWWVRPSTLEVVDAFYRQADCKSRSEFVEKAVLFYSGYLAHQGNRTYLPSVLVSTFRGMLDSYEDRQASLLFKLAVELSMLLHVTAAVNNIDEEALTRLRGRCVQEVKALHGSVSLENAVRFQRGD